MFIHLKPLVNIKYNHTWVICQSLFLSSFMPLNGRICNQTLCPSASQSVLPSVSKFISISYIIQEDKKRITTYNLHERGKDIV